MVQTIRLFLFLGAFLTLSSSFARGAATSRFADYPAAVEVIKKPAQIQINDAQSRRSRSELREASRHAPDFAGHFILATWGCGASCVMAAAIDAKTGAVTRLPFTVSNWPLDVTEPLTYQLDSRLMVIQGSRNEKGNGTYYYEFEGHTLKLSSEPHLKP